MTTLRLRSRLATAALAVTAAGTAFGGLVAGLGVPAAATAVGAPAAASIASEGSGPGEIGTGVSLDPSFLKAAQLPQGDRFGKWKASRIYTGTPRNPKFCLENVLPAAETRYVTYRGKTNVAAEEFISVTGSDAEAQALVNAVRAQVQSCFQTWLNTDIPQYRDGHRQASWKRYGTSKVEDGMTVVGVFTVPPKGYVKTSHLYAIGRDGNRVIVFHLGVPGDKTNAPVKGFTKAGAKGLRQAF